MKRIAIFCDGTWNKPDADHPTNVRRLHKAVLRTAPDGVEQLPGYIRGVGTADGGSAIFNTVDQFGGGAFGWGLEGKITATYTWLAENFEPGDHLFLFGFSRGAYTARSLGGLIRASGIPDAANRHRIPEAIARYKDRDEKTKPSTDESAEWRWGFAPQVTTGETEEAWRARTGKDPGTPLRIHYMGIWDTVGALGVPGVFGAVARPFNAKYLFHDAILSSSVLAGRHALATDEARPFYPPTVWENLDELNEGKADRPYRQEWFPGDHGIIGGSGGERGISNYTLGWIAEGAEAQGLKFDTNVLAGFHGARAFGGGLSNIRRRLIRKERTVSEHAHDVARVTLYRLKFGGADGSSYDPGTLSPLKAHLAPHLPTERHADFP